MSTCGSASITSFSSLATSIWDVRIHQPQCLRNLATDLRNISKTITCAERMLLIIKNVLFSKSSDELVDMVQDKSEPMIVRLMVREHILKDFKKGGLVNLSVLLDRAFGSPKQDVEVSGNVTVTEMTYEEREAKINEYISKKYPGNMPGSSDTWCCSERFARMASHLLACFLVQFRRGRAQPCHTSSPIT